MARWAGFVVAVTWLGRLLKKSKPHTCCHIMYLRCFLTWHACMRSPPGQVSILQAAGCLRVHPPPAARTLFATAILPMLCPFNAGERCAAVDAKMADSSTALMFAAAEGHLEIARYLAGERGAAVDAKKADGFTALMLAAERGHLEIVRYLAGERGAAVDAKAANGFTALMVAAKNDHHDVQRYLAYLAATQSKQKAEAHARELAQEEERARIAAPAELTWLAGFAVRAES